MGDHADIDRVLSPWLYEGGNPPETKLLSAGSGPDGGPLKVTTAAVKKAGAVAGDLAARVGRLEDEAGQTGRDAAAGLAGWETQAALTYMTETWGNQVASLHESLARCGSHLVNNAASYANADGPAPPRSTGRAELWAFR